MADRVPPENVLSGAYLSRVMVASLPTDVSPHLKTPADAIALGTHASLLAVGFRLVGLGEDHRIEAQSDSKETQPLPAEWNAQNGSYAFRYRHHQSSMEFLVKMSRMGSKVVINAMGLGDDRTCTFDLKPTEFVSEGNLPLTIETTNKEEADKKVIDTFISVGRLSDLGSLMRVKLIQKLVPSIHKEGYEEEKDTSSSSTREPAPAPGREDDRPRRDPLRDDRDPLAQPYPLHDPLAHPRQPRRPLPEPIPGFEDEYEVQRPGRGMGQPGGFPRIGERDLYPQGLGPNDPFRGGVGPGFGGGIGGGGMHPTFDDPLFAGQGQRGGGYDPQAPPGSRFDPPFGPGGPGGGHPRGAGMGGRPPNPFGGFGGGDFI